jgi:hypothetical protein
MANHALQQRYIDRQKLMESLYTWIEDIVCDLFLQRTGTYRFDVLENVDRYRIGNLSIGYELLIMEATRRKDELARMQRAIPPDMILVPSLSRENASLKQTSPFADYAAFVIEHLDGIESVESLNRHPLCPDYRLYETLCVLLEQRRIAPMSPDLTKAIHAAGSRMSEGKRRLRSFSLFALLLLFTAGAGFWWSRHRPEIRKSPTVPEPTNQPTTPSTPKSAEATNAETQTNCRPVQKRKPSPKTQPSQKQAAEKRTSPKPHPTTPRAATPTKMPAENLLATMSEQLAEKKYQEALETYDLLPHPEAGSSWALICRQRALSALNKTAELERFFSNHSVHDGEYYMAKATFAARKGRYTEGLTLAKKARNTPCEYIDEYRVGRETTYIHALCRWGLWNADKSEEARKEALGRWFDVKYMYRSNQNHPRFKDANEKIRILTQAR